MREVGGVYLMTRGPLVPTTRVEPGEEAGTDGGCGGWRSITAVIIITWDSIVICFTWTWHHQLDRGGAGRGPPPHWVDFGHV